MDFAWTAEQERLRASVLEFATKELVHPVREHDRTSTFSHQSWRKCAEFGILGGNIPRQYGGSGRSVLDNVLIMEALGYGCRDNGFTLGLNAQMWTINQPILTFGTDAQKQEFLPRLARGECIAADAITEENAGSDALGMETTARRDGDSYILNGRKQYIGFAPIADLLIAFAKTDPSAGPWGISAFLLDADSEGIQRSSNREKLGLRTLPMGEIQFEDCRIPADRRLGREGVGMSLFNHTIEWERSFILASHVGSMARQLDMSIEHAKNRRQFGKKIGDFQSVSNRIVDMRVRLETSRLLMYKAAWLKQEGKPATLEANMTNLAVAEAFLESSMEAIRVHGGKGYLQDFEIERDLRDAVGGVIYAGTSDIQRNLIARILGL
jgi:alkylation response protein AidB-like acyl-CoA dehydrogenase